MKKGYTHITVILDRSGSMESIREDTVGGLNSFLRSQKAEPGDATLTLVQFDTTNPYEVIHRFKPIGEVPELTSAEFVPRSATPLLDALGRGINDLERSISELQEDEPPEKVVFAVVTDGNENSSMEFRKDQIEKMVREKTEKNNWQFVFLSSDLSAFADANGLGIKGNSRLLYEKNAQGTQGAWSSLSKSTSDYRNAHVKKMAFKKEDQQQNEASEESSAKQ